MISHERFSTFALILCKFLFRYCVRLLELAYENVPMFATLASASGG
jgi:hypothetical protein